MEIESSANSNGSYYPASPTSAYFNDTLTALGDNSIEGFPGVNAVAVTAKCLGIFVYPRLDLEKTCNAVLEVCEENKEEVVVYFTGRAINNGNVALVNVYIEDWISANQTKTFGPYTIQPGDYVEFSDSYLPVSPTDAAFSDKVTAVGDIIILGYGSVTANEAIAVCRGFNFHPELLVVKTCSVLVSKEPGCILGLKVNYTGYVENVGDVKVVNVVVTDDRGTPSNTSDDDHFGPFDLDIGQSQTFSGSYYPCEDVTDSTDVSELVFQDTVVANGEHVVLGFAPPATVSATASCRVCDAKSARTCCS